MIEIQKEFERKKSYHNDINEHLDTLYKYALESETIIEFGVRHVTSTWAFLLARPKKITSYDITSCPNIKKALDLSNEYNINFDFKTGDTRSIDIPEVDLLFIDTLHTYEQLSRELQRHANFAKKYIILHDTKSYDFKDEGTLLSGDKRGLKNAYQDFLKSDKGKPWKVKEEFENNNGLTILSRGQNV